MRSAASARSPTLASPIGSMAVTRVGGWPARPAPSWESYSTTRQARYSPGDGASPISSFGWERRLAWPPLRLAAVIGALTALRVAIAAFAPLTDDEAYYRLWALAPAMSYFDHPPMTAWMIAAGMWIAGDNPLGIRLAAPVTSLFGPFILWRAGSIFFCRTMAGGGNRVGVSRAPPAGGRGA